jgi:hypothetical protein
MLERIRHFERQEKVLFRQEHPDPHINAKLRHFYNVAQVTFDDFPTDCCV